MSVSDVEGPAADVVGDTSDVSVQGSRDRAVIASAAASLMARLLSALGSIVSLALAARSLTGGELGVVSILSVLVVYFGFGDFGIGTLLMTRLPAARARGDHAEMKRLVSAAISAMTMVAAALAVIGLGSLAVVPWRSVLGAGAISERDLRWTLLEFFSIGTVGIIGTIGTRILASMQRGALVQVCSAAASIVSMFAVGVCSYLNGPMWSFLVAFTAPFTIIGLLQLWWSVRRYPELAPERWGVGVREGFGLLRSGIQYGVLSAGWVVAYTLDAVVVSAILGAEKAAVFAVAARMFSLVVGTLTLAGQQMWPAIADALARGDREWVRVRVRHSLVVAFVVSAAASLFLVVAGRTLARVWVGGGLVPPESLLIAFAVWSIYMTVITQYSYLLMAGEWIRVLAILGIVVAVVNIVASIALTHAFGMTGPILGNMAGAVLVQLGPTLWLTRRMLRAYGIRETSRAVGRHRRERFAQNA